MLLDLVFMSDFVDDEFNSTERAGLSIPIRLTKNSFLRREKLGDNKA